MAPPNISPPSSSSRLYGSVNEDQEGARKKHHLILHTESSKSSENFDQDTMTTMNQTTPLLGANGTSSSTDPVSTYTTNITNVCDTNGTDHGDKIIEVETTPKKSKKVSVAIAASAEARRKRMQERVLVKTQSSFWEDSYYFKDGSIPHSVVLALTIGVVCGTAAYLYYTCLFWLLQFTWHTLPEEYLVVPNPYWPEYLYVLWIPIVGVIMAVGVGLTVVYLGEPGDLPYTVKCVHEKAYVAMSHVMPMVCASQFSIIGGGSLGPEAPLVAICASLGGFISRSIFHQTNRNLVRKHTLMGMAGALAAFFGCPLGGSLFAMEVNSRFGIEVCMMQWIVSCPCVFSNEVLHFEDSSTNRAFSAHCCSLTRIIFTLLAYTVL